jgi:hypothetical protein
MLTDVHFEDPKTASSNIDTSPVDETKKNMKHIFQKNVGKLMNGLRFLQKSSSCEDLPIAAEDPVQSSIPFSTEETVPFESITFSIEETIPLESITFSIEETIPVESIPFSTEETNPVESITFSIEETIPHESIPFSIEERENIQFSTEENVPLELITNCAEETIIPVEESTEENVLLDPIAICAEENVLLEPPIPSYAEETIIPVIMVEESTEENDALDPPMALCAEETIIPLVMVEEIIIPESMAAVFMESIIPVEEIVVSDDGIGIDVHGIDFNNIESPTPHYDNIYVADDPPVHWFPTTQQSSSYAELVVTLTKDDAFMNSLMDCPDFMESLLQKYPAFIDKLTTMAKTSSME